MLVKYSYDHNYEVYQLKLNMHLWNEYFINNKISNIWVDVFNHHNYYTAISKADYELHTNETWPTWDQLQSDNYSDINKNILEEIGQICDLSCPDKLFNVDLPNRDLLSQLAIKNGLLELDSKYHLSSWEPDSNKVKFLKDKGILDPISLHPTQQGHKEIAEMFYQTFDKIVNE